MASATIVGLATFGSLVATRVFENPKTANSWGFAMTFGGVMIVIVYQSYLMYGVCCGGIDSVMFAGLFWSTVFSLTLIIIGYVVARKAWLKNEKDSSNTPG